jgi:hypothetical protein
MALIGYVGASFGKKGLGLLGLPVIVGIQPGKQMPERT